MPPGVDPAGVAIALGKEQRDRLGLRGLLSDDPGFNILTVSGAQLAALGKLEGGAQEGGSDLQQDKAHGRRLRGRVGGICPAWVRQPPLDDEVLLDDLKLGYALGATCTQMLIQEPVASKLARSLFTIGMEVDGRLLAEAPEALSRLVEQLRGIPLADLIQTAALLLAHGRGAPFFHLEESIAGVRDTELSAESAREFVTTSAVDVRQVRRILLDDLAAFETLEGKAATFFLRHPLIDLGTGHYALAPSSLLVEILGTGLLLDLMARARREFGRADNHLSRFLGSRFESYVGLVLESFASRHDVVPEFEYERKSNARTSDFLIFDHGSRRTATLVEAKLLGLPESAYSGGLWSDSAQVLGARIAKPLAQVLKFLYRSEEALGSGSVRDDAEEPITRLHSATRLNILIAAPVFPSALVLRELRGEVETQLSAVLGELEREKAWATGIRAWWQAYRSKHRVGWTVFSVLDLEYFGGWDGGKLFGRLLASYVEEQSCKRLELEFFKPLSWHNWLKSGHKSYRGDLPQSTAELTKSLWRWSAEQVYGDGASEGMQ